MKYKLHSDASTEYKTAVKYYSNISKNLAKDFVINIEKNINHILEFPKASPQIGHNIRKCALKRFPFCIYYMITNDLEIYILAIMHTNRHPNYWKKRK